MIYCGIDLASETSAVCLLNEAGTMIHEQAISTEAADFEQVLAGHKAVRCVVEASPLAEWVVCILEDLDHEAIIILKTAVESRLPRRLELKILDYPVG